MPKRVLTVAPLPPEKCAYALARYSRSPDSIRQSLEWVRSHDSAKFLESFYFQYGHQSIADLGHVVMCFEGISELAATEVEDEQLWDGQARSSRYQDFAKTGFITPSEFTAEQACAYERAAHNLMDGYRRVHTSVTALLCERLPCPESMKPEMYQRNIAARAFDVARYLLFFGIPTGVGQVTSIRTLERQIRRLKASEYAELRTLAEEIAEACSSAPSCALEGQTTSELVAPTLARHVGADTYSAQSREDLRRWAAGNLRIRHNDSCEPVDLIRPSHTSSDIVATLLYPVCQYSYRDLYETVSDWNDALRNEVIDVALQSRAARADLQREFQGGLFAYDFVMDVGAYRDLHRHRRCQQFRQPYSTAHGFDVPELIHEAGLADSYSGLLAETFSSINALPSPASHYLLPFAARSRFLFKMDFAEVEYIARVRSGVKGHFSYRQIAWKMKEKMEQLEPALGRLMQATPPWMEDPLKR